MLQLDAKYTIASRWAVLLGKEFLFAFKGAPEQKYVLKYQVPDKRRSHCTEYHRFGIIRLVPTDSHFPKW